MAALKFWADADDDDDDDDDDADDNDDAGEDLFIIPSSSPISSLGEMGV
jgi:hypothetical protein